jgi:hypothetical protein
MNIEIADFLSPLAVALLLAGSVVGTRKRRPAWRTGLYLGLIGILFLIGYGIERESRVEKESQRQSLEKGFKELEALRRP